MRSQVLTVALCAFCVGAPIANMSGRFVKGTPLGGFIFPPPEPTFSWRTFISEEWQQAAVKWFEFNYGFRNFMVRFDSTLTFEVTGETPVASNVRVGTDGVLFVEEDVNYLNRTSEPTRASITIAVEQIGRVQELASRRGKALIPVISPSKTSIVRHSVGARWRRANVEKPSSDETYATFVDEMRMRGVTFVDGRAILVEGARQDERVFMAGARHWSPIGACDVFEKIVSANESLRGEVQLEHVDCSAAARVVDSPRDLPDFDLAGLLNVWERATTQYRAVELPTITPSKPASHPVLVVGTSMADHLANEAERRRAFSTVDSFYYNVTHRAERWRRAEHPPHPLDVGSDEWKGLIRDSRMIILEFAEWYLPRAEETFLSQLEKALSEPQ